MNTKQVLVQKVAPTASSVVTPMSSITLSRAPWEVEDAKKEDQGLQKK